MVSSFSPLFDGKDPIFVLQEKQARMPAREGESPRGHLLAVLLIALVVRAVPALLTAGEVAPETLPTVRARQQPAFPGDIGLFHRAGILVSRGMNPYIFDRTYSTYPPLWVGYSYRAYLLSRQWGIPFGLFFKGVGCLADLGTTLLLFLAATSAGRSSREAFGCAAFFALNPVSIIITSLHAPSDPVILFLIVLALQQAGRGRYGLSYLALGMGIAIKIYPVLLVPFFLLHDPAPWPKRILWSLLVPLPFVVTLIPFGAQAPVVVGQVASYGGVTDFGYLSVGRTWLLLQDRLPPGLAPELFPRALLLGKILFLAAYGALLLYWRSFTLPRATLAVFLLFLGIYGGISAQYLLWVIPLALLPASGDNRSFLGIYSLLAMTAILIFYMLFHPGMFTGAFLWPKPGSLRIHGGAHMAINLLLWGATLVWGWRLCMGRLRPPSPEKEGTSGSPR